MVHSFGSVDFIEVMEVLDKRFNDKGKLWRHVFKVRPYSDNSASKGVLTISV